MVQMLLNVLIANASVHRDAMKINFMLAEWMMKDFRLMIVIGIDYEIYESSYLFQNSQIQFDNEIELNLSISNRTISSSSIAVCTQTRVFFSFNFFSLD